MVPATNTILGGPVKLAPTHRTVFRARAMYPRALVVFPGLNHHDDLLGLNPGDLHDTIAVRAVEGHVVGIIDSKLNIHRLFVWQHRQNLAVVDDESAVAHLGRAGEVRLAKDPVA